MTCIPKHVACDWWDPEDPTEGGFVAGATDCVLADRTEARARRNAGGLRLKSVDFGVQADNIQVGVIIYNTPSPTLKSPRFPTSITTSDLGTVGSITTELVELSVTDYAGDTTYYYARQKTQTGSPSCLTNGTNQLQSALALDADRFVELPEEDKGNFNTTCRISSFSVGDLSGGQPALPSPAEYRTGPYMTMCFTTTSENLTNGNTISDDWISTLYFNGYGWKPYDATVSPPDFCAGSPIVCTGGPEADL